MLAYHVPKVDLMMISWGDLRPPEPDGRNNAKYGRTSIHIQIEIPLDIIY